MAKKASYGNESISQLKGPDQVRKRPAVIFGSDGIEGCEHSVFEIITNSIDEAREGYGKKINMKSRIFIFWFIRWRFAGTQVYDNRSYFVYCQVDW